METNSLINVNKREKLHSETRHDKDNNETATPWPSVYIAGICGFFQALQLSIYASSMWPYLRKLDPDISESSYGTILAAYSIAQCIGAPAFGVWSNKIKQIRLPLFVGFIGMLLGNVMYLTLERAPIFWITMIMVATRFTVGAGSAVLLLPQLSCCCHAVFDDTFWLKYLTEIMETNSLIEVSRREKLPSETKHDEDSISNSEYRTPWFSIYIAGVCAFIQAVQFSIYASSMWPYLRKLDPEISESSYGTILTAYSIAQCIGAPTFGVWSNKIKQIRLPLFVGFISMTLGNAIYLTLEHVSIFWITMIMMATRFTVGAGSGNITLLRAYVSTVSTKDDRMRAVSCVSGGIAVGSMIGPALQLLFTPFGETGVSVFGFFHFNVYTGPAILSLMLNLVGIALVKFCFNETIQTFESDNGSKTGSRVRAEVLALFIIIATRFSQIFLHSTTDMINSPFTMMMFHFNKEEAVKYNALVYAVAGSLGALLYFFFIVFNVGKQLNSRACCILAQITFVTMFVVTYPWPFLSEKVELRQNGSDYGCDSDRFTWCSNLTVISIWVYYGFYILVFGIAYALLNATLNTLYSHIIGPQRQGTLQGIFQVAGSLARIIAPLNTSYLYTKSGPRIVWGNAAMEGVAVLSLWFIFFRRLIPYEESQKQKAEQSET